MKCNETIGKWCKNKHGASKIIDTFETYHWGTKMNNLPRQLAIKNLAGTSGMPARGQPLIPIINWLLEPVQSGDDPEQTKEVLGGRCQALVDEALAMQQERERFNRELREYEAAQGFTPVIT
jgi:hypothetical protein